MANDKKQKGLIGVGLLSSIAASLCCITPVLAFVGGSSGFASSFSWLEPARPYLIGLTILVIGFAWWQKLKPKKTDADCVCDEDEKPSFWHSKMFLGIITFLAVLMISFPYYGHVFYPDNKKEVMYVNPENIKHVHLQVVGMTCDACEKHIEHAVNELNGIVDASANHIQGTAEVKFDNSRLDVEDIVEAINATSYKVAEYNLVSE